MCPHSAHRRRWNHQPFGDARHSTHPSPLGFEAGLIPRRSFFISDFPFGFGWLRFYFTLAITSSVGRLSDQWILSSLLGVRRALGRSSSSILLRMNAQVVPRRFREV